LTCPPNCSPRPRPTRSTRPRSSSLPYAYGLVESLAKQLDASEGSLPFADNQTPPPSEAERGQMLRALASDAIRSSLEDHFGVRLAFQNCHRVAVFRPGAENADSHRDFTSQRAQLLNSPPNCATASARATMRLGTPSAGSGFVGVADRV
jgi:hypothetical protein